MATTYDIIIKSADKGGAACVWGEDKCITESMHQLENAQYYSLPPSNPLDLMKKRA